MTETEKAGAFRSPAQNQDFLQVQDTTGSLFRGSASGIGVSLFQNISETKKPVTKTIIEVLNAIRTDSKIAKKIVRLRELLAIGRKDQYDAEKKSLPNFTPHGSFTARNNGSCMRYSGLVVCDYDHLGADLPRVRDVLANNPNVLLIFLSPSGDGLKTLIRVDLSALPKEPDPVLFRHVWESVATHYQSIINIAADSSGKDLSRACFLSHDPGCYFNPAALPMTISMPEMGPVVKQSGSVARVATVAVAGCRIAGALKAACDRVRAAETGKSNVTLRDESLKMGGLIGLDKEAARQALSEAARDRGKPEAEIADVIRRCLAEGSRKPWSLPADAKPISWGGWPEPQPLISKMDSEPYPVDALPPMIRAAVDEVQAFVKCPIALVASSALAAVSVASQGHVDIERAERLTGPAGLYFLTVAESGERKTSCDGFFRTAIENYQTREAERAKPIISRYRADLESWEARKAGIREKIKAMSREGKPTTAFEELLRELELQRPVEPKYPRLLRGDDTPESLGRDLAKQWPSAGIIVSEAGLVLGGHAMNGETIMRNLGLLNILWEGGALAVGRKSVEGYTVRGARLTMSLQIQEMTLKTFFNRSGGLARGTGFFARFLIAWPESTQGTRFFKDPPKDWPCLERFNNRLADILNSPVSFDGDGLNPIMQKLSPEAKTAWVDFHDALESELASGGELQDVKDVASKAADNLARLACLLSFFEHGIGAVGGEAVQRASRVVAWHLNESRRFFGELAMPEDQALACRLDAWLLERCQRSRVDRVSTRDVQRNGPCGLRDKESLKTAIAELMELGRVQVAMDGKKKQIVLNPAILEGVSC